MKNSQQLLLKPLMNSKSLVLKVTTAGKYPAWKPDINEFTQKVLDIYRKHSSDAKLEAIHAGLECAIFKDQFPNLKVVSIGPNIFSPHSNAERVEIDSILRVEKIVNDIIDSL